MKEFKENVINKMIEKSQDMRIVSLRETAAELGINHISAQDTRDIAQRLRKVEGYHLVQMMNTPNDSLFCSLCLVENGVEFDDGKVFSDEKKYIVVCDVDGGDSWTDVYDTAEEANEAALHDWRVLSSHDQRRQHIWAGIVSREDLGDDAIDEDTGEIDWRCWVNADTFPGAFDSNTYSEGTNDAE